jgi:hypothetical protein
MDLHPYDIKHHNTTHHDMAIALSLSFFGIQILSFPCVEAFSFFP